MREDLGLVHSNSDGLCQAVMDYRHRPIAIKQQTFENSEMGPAMGLTPFTGVNIEVREASEPINIKLLVYVEGDECPTISVPSSRLRAVRTRGLQR